MNVPFPVDPLATAQQYFQLTVKPGILTQSLEYLFTPRWNTGGFCRVQDWGDGTSTTGTVSGTSLKHTYAEAGTYTIRIQGSCYRVVFGNNSPYADMVYDINSKWVALGSLTSISSMFRNCGNAVFTVHNLPQTVETANMAFHGCSEASLQLTELPSVLRQCEQGFYGCKKSNLKLTNLPLSLVKAAEMFSGCQVAQLNIQQIPYGVSSCFRMFNNCYKAVIDLGSLTASAPAEGWTGLTTISYMFYNAGSGNTPGTVTGSRAAFLAKLPNVINTTNAFYGTNTTQ